MSTPVASQLIPLPGGYGSPRLPRDTFNGARTRPVSSLFVPSGPSGPNILPPAPSGGGGGGSFLGDIGRDIVRGGLDLAGDLIRQRLTGTGSEGASGEAVIPSAGNQIVAGGGVGGGCPAWQIPMGDVCVDVTALPPGGRPALTGQTSSLASSDGFGGAVNGMFGVGLVPRAEVQTVRSCPRGMVLGKDGVCYSKRTLRKSDRMWDPGTKPLMTGGDRNAIRRAAAAGRKLERAKKQLRGASKALGKAC